MLWFPTCEVGQRRVTSARPPVRSAGEDPLPGGATNGAGQGGANQIAHKPKRRRRVPARRRDIRGRTNCRPTRCSARNGAEGRLLPQMAPRIRRLLRERRGGPPSPVRNRASRRADPIPRTSVRTNEEGPPPRPLSYAQASPRRRKLYVLDLRVRRTVAVYRGRRILHGGVGRVPHPIAC